MEGEVNIAKMLVTVMHGSMHSRKSYIMPDISYAVVAPSPPSPLPHHYKHIYTIKPPIITHGFNDYSNFTGVFELTANVTLRC